MDNTNFRYYCEECGSSYEISKDLMLCPNCKEEDIEGKPLKGVLTVSLPKALEGSFDKNEPLNIFKYLPVEEEFFPPIPVGNTPLVNPKNLEKYLGTENLFIKFDGLNPTGSYKDRASYLVSAFAKKFGIQNITLASTGNAASSMAGIAASAGQNAIIFMPSTAPKAKLIQCLQYGAKLIPVAGNYDAAFDLSLKYSKITGYLNRNTAYNPMTIEGKKTSSFEIVAGLKWEAPDYIFVPVGDGVVISGVIKGLLDLLYIGAINKLPKVIGVQSDKSSFLYDSIRNDKMDFGYKATTIADSISVDVARNGYKALRDIKVVNGEYITVSDNSILEAQKLFSAKSGIFSEPSSAAAAAGYLQYKDKIAKGEKAVVLLSGSGLKDIDNASKIVDYPEVYPTDIDMIMERLAGGK